MENGKSMAVGLLLPQGWGWLRTEPEYIRETLDSIVRDDMDAGEHEELILRSIDELLALRTGLGPWQPIGIAAWTESVLIGGTEEHFSATLLVALQFTGRALPIDDLQMAVGRSRIERHVTMSTSMALPGRAAVRLEAHWAGMDDSGDVRSWIYLAPVPELQSLAMMLFTTPDQPDWESYGELFDAMAGTFAVAPEQSPDSPLDREPQPSGT